MGLPLEWVGGACREREGAVAVAVAVAGGGHAQWVPADPPLTRPAAEHLLCCCFAPVPARAPAPASGNMSEGVDLIDIYADEEFNQVSDAPGAGLGTPPLVWWGRAGIKRAPGGPRRAPWKRNRTSEGTRSTELGRCGGRGARVPPLWRKEGRGWLLEQQILGGGDLGIWVRMRMLEDLKRPRRRVGGALERREQGARPSAEETAEGWGPHSLRSPKTLGVKPSGRSRAAGAAVEAREEAGEKREISTASPGEGPK